MRGPFKHIDDSDVWAGLLAPIPFVAYGLWCVITKKALVWHHFSPDRALHLHDDGAVAIGVAAFAIALALHMHCIWGRLKGIWVVARLFEAAALITIVLSLSYVIWLAWLDWFR
jgi:hypothetical protein